MSFGSVALAFVVVGALLTIRRAENAVGWLMLAIGVVMTVLVASGQYAGYALLGDPSLPLGLELAWLGSWVFLPMLALVNVLLLVFPLGRLERPPAPGGARERGRGSHRHRHPSRPARADGRLRRAPEPVRDRGPRRARCARSSACPGRSRWIAFLIAVASVFTRLRHARGDERQQLKWFAYAAGLLVLCQVPNVLPLGLDSSLLGLLLVIVAFTAVPARWPWRS